MHARRRLWELPVRHHCVLLGAAFDVRELRQLFRRAGSRDYAAASNYELHSSAVHFARESNAFSGPVHRLLDERFRDMLLRFRDAATAGELLERWKQFAARGEAISAYWAALTHPACDDALDETLGLEMHMAAHHAFAERRAAARRLRQLQERVIDLERTLTGARDRVNGLKRETARLREESAASEGRLREVCSQRDAAFTELEGWRYGKETDSLRERVAALTSALSAREQAAKAERCRLKEALREAQRRIGALERPSAQARRSELRSLPLLVATEADLARRRVLCLGGKTSLVPHYREIVERARGEFVHHDGGIEHHLSRLPAMLSAADAVICLAGDCSHSAYRLAKRYCKAKGKPCALLANSSVRTLSSCVERFPANTIPRRHASTQ